MLNEGVGSVSVTYANLVGGRWLEPTADRWFEDKSPANVDDVIGRLPLMTADDVHAACRAAADAASGWRRLGRYGRGRILARAATVIRERADGLSRDITREMGKVLREARGEVERAADFFEYYAVFGRLPEGDLLPDERPGVRTWSVREPLGVVVAITPWNDPLVTPARKVAPALIAGNTVVLKPSPFAPLIALRLAQALTDAGLPPGVLNTVTGEDAEIGPALLSDPNVQAVSFTGSTNTGSLLRRELCDRPVRLQTEMGGKNAITVAEDADLELAATGIVSAAYGQAGERCTAASRIVVFEGVRDALLDALHQRIDALRVGLPDAPESDMGPVVSEVQLGKVLNAVEQAERDGARAMFGGKRLTEGLLAKGYFIAPGVVVDVPRSSSFWRDEIFGPVIGVRSVQSLDEALAEVNNSSYGLSASIFTTSLATAHAFAEGVETGCVTVNLPTTGWDVHVPFGGFKNSGSPFKEHGIQGLEFYTRIKSVAMKVS